MNEGIYELSMKQYLADPCPNPSFTSSAANAILGRSARHAWHEHCRLNPNYTERHDTKFDLGTAVHSLFLEGDDTQLVEIEHDSFRTKAAREERDGAYNAGLTPLLTKHVEQARLIADASKQHLADCDELANRFSKRLTERTLIWTEPGKLWARARPDLISDDSKLVLNYKTTGTNAEPESYGRGYLNRGGLQVQAYHHCRAVEMVLKVMPKYVWMVQEVDPPYECSFPGMAPSLHDFASEQWSYALHVWHGCMQDNEWPGYPKRIAWLEAPIWAVKQFCDRPDVEDVIDASEVLKRFGEMPK